MAATGLSFKGGAVEVASLDIESLTLVTPLPFAARIYIGPWLVLYPLAAYAFYGNYDKYIKSLGTLLCWAVCPIVQQDPADTATRRDVPCAAQSGPSSSASSSLAATRSASLELAGASRSGVGARRDT